MQLIATDRQQRLHRITVHGGDNVMELLRDSHLDIEAVCGGCCSCATCHVWIAPEWRDQLAPRGDLETQLLSLSEHFDEARSRLSCQLTLTAALDGLTLAIAPED